MHTHDERPRRPILVAMCAACPNVRCCPIDNSICSTAVRLWLSASLLSCCSVRVDSCSGASACLRWLAGWHISTCFEGPLAPHNRAAVGPRSLRCCARVGAARVPTEYHGLIPLNRPTRSSPASVPLWNWPVHRVSEVRRPPRGREQVAGTAEPLAEAVCARSGSSRPTRPQKRGTVPPHAPPSTRRLRPRAPSAARPSAAGAAVAALAWRRSPA